MRRHVRSMVAVAGILTGVLAGSVEPVLGKDGVPEVLSARLLRHGEATRMLLEIDAPVTVRVSTPTGTDRVVVDFPELAELAWPGSETPKAGQGVIRSYHLEHLQPQGVRLVFETTGPVSLHHQVSSPATGPHRTRLIFDLAAAPPEDSQSGPAAGPAGSPAAGQGAKEAGSQDRLALPEGQDNQLAVPPPPLPPHGTSSIRPLLEELLANHKRVAASRAEQEGAQASLSHAFSAWFPDLILSGSGGHQTMTYTNGTPDTDLTTRSVSFSLRQTLWDFGATNAGIDKAQLAVRQAEVALTQVSQDLLLEGLTACINLDRARRSLAFAGQSVANIQKQTGMEESRVELGAGVTSDVLQAKSQLAGALARVARAKGQVTDAVNRFRAVFSREPLDDDPVQTVPVPFDLLPPTLPSAIAFALKHNPQLEVLNLTAEADHSEVDRVRATELYPNIHATAERLLERNPDGVTGERDQYVAKVEMTYHFNTGLGGFSAVTAAQKAAVSADDRYAETRDLIEEQVRNAWQALDTARENAHYLDNQVRIVNAFLLLAREERLRGLRSLIDVLTGETSLINAQSDAASADADVSVAAFTLFRATGLLEPTIIP